MNVDMMTGEQAFEVKGIAEALGFDKEHFYTHCLEKLGRLDASGLKSKSAEDAYLRDVLELLLCVYQLRGERIAEHIAALHESDKLAVAMAFYKTEGLVKERRAK